MRDLAIARCGILQFQSQRARWCHARLFLYAESVFERFLASLGMTR